MHTRVEPWSSVAVTAAAFFAMAADFATLSRSQAYPGGANACLPASKDGMVPSNVSIAMTGIACGA